MGIKRRRLNNIDSDYYIGAILSSHNLVIFFILDIENKTVKKKIKLNNYNKMLYCGKDNYICSKYENIYYKEGNNTYNYKDSKNLILYLKDNNNITNSNGKRACYACSFRLKIKYKDTILYNPELDNDRHKILPISLSPNLSTPFMYHYDNILLYFSQNSMTWKYTNIILPESDSHVSNFIFSNNNTLVYTDKELKDLYYCSIKDDESTSSISLKVFNILSHNTINSFDGNFDSSNPFKTLYILINKENYNRIIGFELYKRDYDYNKNILLLKSNNKLSSNISLIDNNIYFLTSISSNSINNKIMKYNVDTNISDMIEIDDDDFRYFLFYGYQYFIKVKKSDIN